MGDALARRVTCATGVASAVLFGVTLGLLMDSPDVTASGDAVLEWGQANRTKLLAGVYTEGLCVLATWAFLIAFHVVLRRGEGPSALGSTVGMVTGVALFAIALVGMTFVAAYGFRATADASSPGALSPATARLLVDLSLLIICMTGFPTAISQAGYVAALWTIPRPMVRASRALAYSGGAIGVLHLISAGCWSTRGGMLSPSGLGLMVCPIVYYLWIVACSICVVLTPDADRAGAPAVTTPLIGTKTLADTDAQHHNVQH